MSREFDGVQGRRNLGREVDNGITGVRKVNIGGRCDGVGIFDREMRPGDTSAARSWIAGLSRLAPELYLSAGAGPDVFLVTLKIC